jgi:hypothetical protein
MRSLGVLGLAVLLATPASAAEMTLKLSDQEQAALMQLLDLAAKQGDTQAAYNLSVMVRQGQ